MSDLPQELFALAAEVGISPADLELVHQIINLTPEIPVHGIAANGQPMGAATVRVAREYDGAAVVGEEGQSLVQIDAPEAGVQIAFIVDRAQLVEQLSLVFTNVPSPYGPTFS